MMISGVRKNKPTVAEPLEDGAMAVSFSDKKWEESVKERATERKKPGPKKKKAPKVVVEDNDGEVK